MRFSLVILLLSATAALAQPAPDKPVIYDGPGPNSFTSPSPVLIGPAPAQEGRPASRAPTATTVIDGLRTEKQETSTTPGKVDLRRVMPDLQQPEPPKPSPHGFG